MHGGRCVFCGLVHDERPCPAARARVRAQPPEAPHPDASSDSLSQGAAAAAAGVPPLPHIRIDDSDTDGATIPHAHPTLIGALLGQYRVRVLLGSGGMSEVYEAEHVELRKIVAIKVLHRERATDRRAVSRLAQEARVVAKLRHPNICETYDLGRLPDGRPFIVMDRLHGETLGRRLQREGAIEPRELVPLILQLLAALVAVHRIGIIHRDLKPENVFLAARTGPTPAVKLLDFGVARSMAPDATPITRIGFVAGTPLYMSPEHISGVRTLDARVDVWGTGVIVYEALAGQPPFWAVKYSALIHQITRAPHKPLRHVDPTIPAELADIVDRALAKDPNHRFASAAEMRDALLAINWTRPSLGPPASRPPTPPPLPPPSVPAPPPQSQRPLEEVPRGRTGLPYLGEHDTTETSLAAAVEKDGGGQESPEFYLMNRRGRRGATRDGPPPVPRTPNHPKRG